VRQRRRRWGLKQRRGLAAALVLVILSSCTGSGAPSPTDGATLASPTGTMTIAAHLAVAPSDCLDSADLLQHTPPWGSYFGSDPVFGSPFGRPDPASNSFHVSVAKGARPSGQGWMVKVLWVLQPGTTEPVTLSGEEEGTGWPITFDPSNGPPASSMRLDPKNPGTPDRRQGWTEYPSHLSFPEAGCYVIKASWPGGSWRKEFGFGT
jgi:hypothetical protein